MLPKHDNNSERSEGVKLICPSCEKVNNPDVAFCAHCGFAFNGGSSTTVIVPKNSPQIPEASQLSHLVNLHPDGLILYIVGRKQPMIIKSNGDIVLGRRANNDNEEKPDVDFTDFDGHILGVSRKHAIIHLTVKGYSIEDLGSSNGTFINEKQLEPHVIRELQSGDLLRMGQFITYIYFNSDRSKAKPRPRPQAQITEHNLLLIERSDTTDLAYADGVPVNYLYNRVLPYLKAMQEIQTAIDTLLKRDSSKLDIGTINVNKKRDGVEVKLISYPEAIKQIADTVTPWKQIHNRNNLVESELRELVVSVLAGALPDVESQQRDTFQDRLMPYVRVLCSSSLDLSRT